MECMADFLNLPAIGEILMRHGLIEDPEDLMVEESADELQPYLERIEDAAEMGASEEEQEILAQGEMEEIMMDLKIIPDQEKLFNLV